MVNFKRNVYIWSTVHTCPCWFSSSILGSPLIWKRPFGKAFSFEVPPICDDDEVVPPLPWLVSEKKEQNLFLLQITYSLHSVEIKRIVSHIFLTKKIVKATLFTEDDTKDLISRIIFLVWETFLIFHTVIYQHTINVDCST